MATASRLPPTLLSPSTTAVLIVTAGQPLPTSYASTMTNAKRVDDVRMVFAGGNVKDFTVEPPVGQNPDRIPLSDADRHSVGISM